VVWIGIISNLLMLLAGFIAWYKQYQIRLDERKHFSEESAKLIAERDSAVRKAQQLLVMDHSERQKLMDIEYEATKDDPRALLDFLNRRL